LHPLGARLADPDQDTSGEWNRLLAGQPDGLEPHGGILVRGTEVRAAAFTQPLRCALQHDALRDRHAAQCGNLRGVEYAWIDVRQQSGLRKDSACGAD
jgi:hypothetical protein